MIVEHVVLPVIPGREAAFEADFAAAREIISAMPGFVGLTLSRQLEQPNLYLLLVEWEQLEDHTVGFRESAQYQDWRALLHPYYDPFPEVTHFAAVDRAEGAEASDVPEAPGRGPRARPPR